VKLAVSVSFFDYRVCLSTASKQYAYSDDNRCHVQRGDPLSSPDSGMAFTSVLSKCREVCAIQITGLNEKNNESLFKAVMTVYR
ncbi:hypothetical protein PND46_11905, partial [Lacticaseibacillus rhamnosus]|uniref:hypothetical protein n=1 Tax=Lacticaseibacillus rhamnosus TaxID=47715 RepID=UPI00232B7EFF